MIRLDRQPAPMELDGVTVAKLTSEYVADTKLRVWNQPYIRAALLSMSHGKCAYCECGIAEESKYMEVDHFRPKLTHPDKVVVWSNLLPSCKRCNVKKGRHDVDIDGMIVDPTTDSPRDHLYFKDCLLHYKDDIGRSTIAACELNQTDRLFAVRISLMAAAHESIEKAKALFEDYLLDPSTNRKRNRAFSTIEQLLITCGPQKPYSALLSTGVIGHSSYIWLRGELVKAGLWRDLQDLESAAQSSSLTQ